MSVLYSILEGQKGGQAMLDKTSYLDAFHADVAALATAARRELEEPVPTCPGWTVATLVTHLIRLYAHRIKLIKLQARENTVRGFDSLDLPAQFKEWFETRPEDLSHLPPGLLELFEQTAAGLEEILRSTEPAVPVWTFWPADQTVGFWTRRMTHETAIHRWDVQQAHGIVEPIAIELARDGIDEFLDVMLHVSRQRKEPRRGNGETYHFHRTDGEGEWMVRFDAEGISVTHEHGKGDAAVRGSASDLMLFLWGRIPAGNLAVFGDASLLARFFELVPPI
jgi:uncharacterized protein (TIGR03083 family)